jgi:exosortase/archaeosortase family protein
MSSPTITLTGGDAGVRSWLRGVWSAARKRRALLPAAGMIGAALIAYHFTLLSLADYLRLDTPLAYLPLLPIFAVWTAVVAVDRYRSSPPPSRELHLDLIVGVPLLVVALLMITLLPAAWSTYYWTDRPDVLSLAVFCAGAITVCFGVGWMLRLRAAIVFMFLMWPALYLHLLPGVMQSVTDGTNTALAAVVSHLPIGVTPHGDGILSLMSGGQPILVTVGTACSGANGALGFALIGGAFSTVLVGRRSLKLLWVVAGIGLSLVFNVLRLVSILALASAGHASLALGAYHSVIGLVLFAVVILVMLAVAPLFRLHHRPLTRRTSTAAPVGTHRGRRIAVPVALGLLTVLSAVADRGLVSYAAFADGTGAPTVAAFDVHEPMPAGLTVSYQTTYDWSKQYYGANSDWSRYGFYASSTPGIVWADIVRTDDRGSLDAYNLQNCFTFHNYDIRNAQRIDLGSGVTGLLLNYRDPDTNANWATVSWAWPVRYHDDTYYERISLTSDLRPGQKTAPDLRPSDGLRSAFIGLVNLFTGERSGPPEATYQVADSTLQAMASSVVAATVHRAG